MGCILRGYLNIHPILFYFVRGQREPCADACIHIRRLFMNERNSKSVSLIIFYKKHTDAVVP